MSTVMASEAVQTMEIIKELVINASPAVVFESLLEELGPGGLTYDGKPYPMTLEPWAGGRWFRDLGETGGKPYGHLWAHVQVIKAPVLLELYGPLMMSFASVNHVQYRLTPEGQGTRLKLVHRAMGTIMPEHREGLPKGWGYKLECVAKLAEAKRSQRPSRA